LKKKSIETIERLSRIDVRDSEYFNNLYFKSFVCIHIKWLLIAHIYRVKVNAEGQNLLSKSRAGLDIGPIIKVEDGNDLIQKQKSKQNNIITAKQIFEEEKMQQKDED